MMDRSVLLLVFSLQVFLLIAAFSSAGAADFGSDTYPWAKKYAMLWKDVKRQEATQDGRLEVRRGLQ
ncbi:hypothetical protein ILYODFUR_033805 [Ilyodon furcidens]|uniref:Uncharacterized protein n=1 Tax=Ilyodon furcidens TaxID=33524 RepID=A0ABV0U1U0_9TELE